MTEALADALLAARLLAADRKLGGIVLRGGGPARQPSMFTPLGT